MAKRNQQRPAKESAGRNNPDKSTEITTGTYKKPETYHKQALEHKNPGKVAQESSVLPKRDMSEGISHLADSRAMMEERERRSGSDSNADKHRKGSRVHEEHKSQKQPVAHDQVAPDYTHDLRPTNLAGENHGVRSEQYDRATAPSAYDLKELHTRLADLTDDELKSITIVPEGSRLEQGAHYIDLQHLEQGEFVAQANMVATPGHYYVPKKDTDYVTWKRLNQVDNPARLDGAER